MKKILITLIFPAFLLACGGNEGSETSSDSSPSAEIEATATEIQTVEETETIGSQVDEVNQDVDSILNSL